MLISLTQTLFEYGLYSLKSLLVDTLTAFNSDHNTNFHIGNEPPININSHISRTHLKYFHWNKSKLDLEFSCLIEQWQQFYPNPNPVYLKIGLTFLSGRFAHKLDQLAFASYSQFKGRQQYKN